MLAVLKIMSSIMLASVVIAFLWALMVLAIETIGERKRNGNKGNR